MSKFYKFAILVAFMTYCFNSTNKIDSLRINSATANAQQGIGEIMFAWTWTDFGASAVGGGVGGAAAGAVACLWGSPVGVGAGALVGGVSGAVGGAAGYAAVQAWDYFFGPQPSGIASNYSEVMFD